jgi:tRNA pseudouridine38-40 synthase
LERTNTVRKIESVHISRHGQELWIDVVGGGFLHAMVRSIAGTLIDVGRGRLPEGTISTLLRTGLRKLAGPTAPACGLTLVRVEYV